MQPSHALDPSIAQLPTTSAKIRALAARGLERAEIARLLNIRYQHVRNVLKADEDRNARSNDPTEQVTATIDDASTRSIKVRLGPDGRVVIPAAFRDAIGLKEGDVLFARLEDGEVHLLTPTAAIRRAQALVRQYVPEGVSLVNELIAERRKEAAREAERE